MKKNKTFIIFFILLLIFFSGLYYFFNLKQNNEYIETKESHIEESNTIDNNINQENSVTDNTYIKPVETTISTFSTKIYTKDAARQNNINITCNLLNNTIIKNQETFSFCDTVGKATYDKGYQKADIFDNNGNKKKGLRWRKLSGK